MTAPPTQALLVAVLDELELATELATELLDFEELEEATELEDFDELDDDFDELEAATLELDDVVVPA
jgi:hypothetical protein